MKELNLSAIYDYDQTLLGNQKSMSPFFFQEKTYGESGVKENALTVLRYAVEDLLKWTPKMMTELFDGEVIKKMKLEKVILTLSKDFPVQLNKKRDYWYYAHMVYPEKIPVDDEALTIKTYRDLASGKISRLQKGFLEGDDGEVRICLCLQYVLNMIAPASIHGLYVEFSDTPKANKLLAKWKLHTALRSYYKYPLDYLHNAIPAQQRDEFDYRYYKFKAIRDDIRRKEYNEQKRLEKQKQMEEKKALKQAVKSKKEVK